jgi:hypothetical protein
MGPRHLVGSLRESHICGTISQAPAEQDVVHLDQIMVHGFWTWWLVSARSIARPTTQAGDDPGIPREQAGIVWISEFRGTAFQGGVQFTQ